MGALLKPIVIYLLTKYVYSRIKDFEDKIGSETTRDIIESITAGVEDALDAIV